MCKGYIFESCLLSKLGNAHFFRNIRHCPLRLTFTIIPTNLFAGSICLLVNCIGGVVIDRGWNFRQSKIFRRRVSGGKHWEPRFFSEGKCYFDTVLWPNIPCMVSQCWLGDGIWNVGCIQFLEQSFPTNSSSKFCLKKYSSQMNFCFIKSLARSACLKTMRFFELRSRVPNLYSNGFSGKVRLRVNFSHGFIAKTSQNRSFFRTCRFFQRLFIVWYKQ